MSMGWYFVALSNSSVNVNTMEGVIPFNRSEYPAMVGIVDQGLSYRGACNFKFQYENGGFNL